MDAPKCPFPMNRSRDWYPVPTAKRLKVAACSFVVATALVASACTLRADEAIAARHAKGVPVEHRVCCSDGALSPCHTASKDRLTNTATTKRISEFTDQSMTAQAASFMCIRLQCFDQRTSAVYSYAVYSVSHTTSHNNCACIFWRAMRKISEKRYQICIKRSNRLVQPGWFLESSSSIERGTRSHPQDSAPLDPSNIAG